MFINPRDIIIQGIYIKVRSVNIYQNFWDQVLSKIQISEIYIYIFGKKVSLIVFRHKFYQKHSWSISKNWLELNLLIQVVSRLSPPPVKLSSL